MMMMSLSWATSATDRALCAPTATSFSTAAGRMSKATSGNFCRTAAEIRSDDDDVAELGDFRHRPRALCAHGNQLLDRSRPDVEGDERELLQNRGGDPI